MTALFVAIFLFFLSVALLWTNRQDIALTLAMEHKLKSESAARTGAMTVFSSLRSFDRPPEQLEQELESGARWKVELRELPAEGGRGPLIRLHARGTSGPVSSHLTWHLLLTELHGDPSSSAGRLVGFLNRAISGTNEAEPSESPTPAPPPFLNPKIQALLGDFELKPLNLQLGPSAEYFAASQGPLFVSSRLNEPQSPLTVNAYLPVFSPLGGAVQAYGPISYVLSPPPVEHGLSILSQQGEEFVWEALPPPAAAEPPRDLGTSLGSLEVGSNSPSWNTLGLQAVGENGTVRAWQDQEPPTTDSREAQGLRTVGNFAVPLASLAAWSEVPPTPPQRGYSLHGAIAAHRDTVYSFAWENLYLHYDGQTPAPPLPPTVGSHFLRWPCVQAYDRKKKTWSTVWSALRDNGRLHASTPLDTAFLLVDSQGQLFSRTLETPPRLAKLESSGGVELLRALPPGPVVMYRDAPHGVSPERNQPGLINLLTQERIGFSSLPTSLPEIAGPVVVEMEGETPDMGLADLKAASQVGATEQPEPRTLRPAYRISYQVDSQSQLLADGQDLFAQVRVNLEAQEPSYEEFHPQALEAPTAPLLMRYDGQRWHVLPNGLMAALVHGLPAPPGEMFCAHYGDLPSPHRRYTVVAIDTDPFEFSR